ncbi:hypothetical protein [Thiobacillus denitrificans]|nr:hypothetical protein [Thiobacillus denitrificans]
MVRDKITGEQREVDVLIATNASGYEVNIAIEVVARGRKADTPWVESMRSKHSSLPTDKLILVAEAGFYAPALAKAKFYGIEAVTIETALAADWKIVAELTATGFFELTSFKYTCAVIYESDGGNREQIDVPSTSSITCDSQQTTLDEFVRYVLNLTETKEALYPRITSMNERQFWFSYSRPGGLWDAEINGATVRVVELRVGLDVDHTRTPVEVSAGKYRNTPFVAGVSSSKTNELQFVLVKKPDGTTEGAVVDASGVRKLIGAREHIDEVRS